jgi:hypothetical protein
MLHAIFPNEPFGTMVRNGTAEAKLQEIIGDIKPEALYFVEFDGRRSAMMLISVADSSQMAALAEPFFVTFNAEVHFRATMSAEDMAKANLTAVGKKLA